MEDSRKDRKKDQIDLSQKLQDLLLGAYEQRLVDGELSDTGLGQLQKLLMANGWSLDPASIPKRLKGHLTSQVDAEKLDEEDPDVHDIRSRLSG